MVRPHTPKLRAFYQELKHEFGSAAALAKAAGVSPASISRILAGRSAPDYESVCALAEALGARRGAELFQVYLQDLVPKELRERVVIQLAADAGENIITRKALKRLPRDSYAALQEFFHLCREREDIVPVLRAILQILRKPHSPASRSQEPGTVLPSGNFPHTQKP